MVSQVTDRVQNYRRAFTKIMSIEPFCSNLPIAVGTGKELLSDPEFMKDLTPRAVRTVLGVYVSRELILRKLVKSGVRYNLKCQPIEARKEHLVYARTKLDQVKERRLSRSIQKAE